MSDLSGQTIRGYEFRRRLGSGSFGAVYQAFQPVIGREVAIKVILPEYANQPDFIRRFEAEAQLIARLEHPHIVPLFDYWREPDGAYLVMRLVRGGSLGDRLDQGPIDMETTAMLLDQIAAALAVAHRSGVIHRDFKPDNVLLDEEGNAYLSDFGLAYVAGSKIEDTGVSGTPGYMAPEQLRGQTVGPQVDIYALGFTTYQMLTGKHPFSQSSSTSELLMMQMHEPMPDISDEIEDIPPAVNLVLQQATAKDPEERYSDAREFAAAFRRAISVQTGMDDMVFITIDFDEEIEITNPYKGLRPFEEADAANFFGRETLIAQLIERMCDPGAYGRFLAVVGPSGSGKSSVVKAGLIPALRRGQLDNSDEWFFAEMVPGTHPLENLVATLRGLATRLPDNLHEQLQANPKLLLNVVHGLLPDSQSQLLLVIDQFEEVFTAVTDEAEREHFLNLLRAAVTEPRSRLRLIITLRADFYDRPLLYEGFAELMQARTQVVVPLTGEEIERTIVGPAERVGLTVDTDLIAAIVSDVREEPGALPLLQYALTEVYERRDGRTLTLAGYQESGGVLGALARRADEVYNDLPDFMQSMSRQLFLRLVTLGEGTEDTRRRVRMSELTSIFQDTEQINDLLGAYTRYRLLTTDQDPETREPTIEVAHEALIREWQTLRDWLDKSREDVRLQRMLAASTHEWLSAGRKNNFLLSGGRLIQFEEWARKTDLALAKAERYYLSSSLKERQRQQEAEKQRQQKEKALERRSRRILMSLVAVLMFAACGGLILTAFALNQSRAAVEAADERATAAQAALDQGATAIAAQATALDAANQQATAAQIALDQGATATIAQGQALIAADAQATAAQNALDQGATATVAQGQAQIEADNAQTQAALASTNEANAQSQSNERATQQSLAELNATEAAVNANNAATAAAEAAENAETAVAAAATSNYNATRSAQNANVAMTNEANSNIQSNQRATQQSLAELNATQAANNANQAATSAANASRNEQTAVAAAATSNYNATRSAQNAAIAMTNEAQSNIAGTQSAINANNEATAAAIAIQNQQTAVAAAATSDYNATQSAINAGIAQTQAAIAATSAAEAVNAQATAVREAAISESLALAAASNIAMSENNRPLAIHLAMLSSRIPNPPIDAQSALFQAVHSTGSRWQLPGATSGSVFIADSSFSPDGQHAYILWGHGALQVLDTLTGQTVSNITFPTDGYTPIVINETGSHVASFIVVFHSETSFSVTVTVWKAATGEIEYEYPASELSTGIALNDSGDTVAAVLSDYTIEVWTRDGNYTTLGMPNNTNPSLGHTSAIKRVSISSNGKLLVSQEEDSNTLLVWDINPTSDRYGEIIQRLDHEVTPFRFGFIPNRNTLAVSYADLITVLRFYDLDPVSPAFGTLMHTFEGGGQGFFDFTFRADGTVMAVTEGAVGLTVLNTSTYEVLHVGSTTTGYMALHPTKPYLFLANQFSGSSIYEYDSGQRGTSILLSDFATKLTYGLDNHHVFFVGANSDRIFLMNLNTGMIEQEFDIPGRNHAESDLIGLHVSRISNRLIAISNDGRLGIWSLDSSQPSSVTPLRTLQLGFGYLEHFSIDGAGNQLVFPLDTSNFAVMNINPDATAFGQVVFDSTESSFFSHRAVFSPDGQYLALSGHGTVAHIIDFRPGSSTYGSIIKTVQTNEDIHRIGFSLDGKLMIVGTAAASIYIWNSDPSSPAFGSLVRSTNWFEGHPILPQGLSQDGNYLVHNMETYASILSLKTGRSIQRYITVQGDYFGEVIYSLDGQNLLASNVRSQVDGTNEWSLTYWRNTNLASMIQWACDNRYIQPLTAEQMSLYNVTEQDECVGSAAPSITPISIIAEMPQSLSAVVAIPTPTPTVTLTVGEMRDDYWVSNGAWYDTDAGTMGGSGTGWIAGQVAGEHILAWPVPLDTSTFTAPQLHFMSSMGAGPNTYATVQASLDGLYWIDMGTIVSTPGLTLQTIGLIPSQTLWLRLRWQSDGAVGDFWLVDELRLVDGGAYSTPEPSATPVLTDVPPVSPIPEITIIAATPEMIATATPSGLIIIEQSPVLPTVEGE